MWNYSFKKNLTISLLQFKNWYSLKFNLDHKSKIKKVLINFKRNLDQTEEGILKFVCFFSWGISQNPIEKEFGNYPPPNVVDTWSMLKLILQFFPFFALFYPKIGERIMCPSVFYLGNNLNWTYCRRLYEKNTTKIYTN